MVIHALKESNLSSSKKEELLLILNSKTKEEAKLRKAISLLNEAASVEYAMNYSTKLMTDSWNLLEPII